ncbi:30S ribosomal protein S16 [Candidatus Wolfebacteria bacterium RIFCSPHIGHO2_01_FULL_48_22]|uniref:Small ribosomal subunit protein bS16 n=2 Tax=Candidatus Wolfeibacteriota TaxID=1752735 RepID=A0A1F8DRM1_9BACT|nr:MAG: 30S ribosomal protein S16 [Candidatus Wolfebacteria bacterium RIFCSPHIGHO2_01_FULL_48_22]OGM92221.1 MAG: 30S ribosomal protein S16 [Candidatus Wolfebacteria bacterium RIFCSPLOWO2_01_FULL_47_17b]
MLAIKLRPIGKKKQISYRVVVMEKKSKLVGKFIEDLGWYNPHTNLSSVNKDRMEYWIKSGAQPTDSVHNLLVREKVNEGPKVPKHGKPKPKTEDSIPNTVSSGAQEEKKEEVPAAEVTEVQPPQTEAEPPKEEPKEEEKPPEA